MNGLTKLCILISLGLFCTLLFTVLLDSSSVKAVSSFDDAYNTTRKLETGANGAYGVNDDFKDITTNWSEYILDKSKWYNSTSLGDADVSLSNAFNHGRWGVSQSLYVQGNGTQNGLVKSVVVYWTEDTSLTLNWRNGGNFHYVVASGNNLHSVFITSRHWQYGNGDNTPIANSYSQDSAIYISDSYDCPPDDSTTLNLQCTRNLFTYSDHLNYPDGYEGITVPSTYSPPLNLTYSINFKINGNFKNFNAMYTNKITNPLSNLPDPSQIRWMLVDKSKVDINQSSVSQRYNPLCDVYLKRDQPFTSHECGDDIMKNLDMSKQYEITAQGLLDSEQEGDYHIEYKFVSFDIDFTKAKYGLDTNDCNLTNTATDTFNTKACESDNRYQDCTQFYGDITKLGDVIGCYINNMKVWFEDIMSFLFVPDPSDINSLFSDADSFFHQKLGLLLYPYDWIYNTFNNMLSAGASCNGVSVSGIPNISPTGTFFGRTVSLNVCSASTSFPRIYNVLVFIVRVVSVLAMVIAVYKKLLVTLKNHDSRGQDLYT